MAPAPQRNWDTADLTHGELLLIPILINLENWS